MILRLGLNRAVDGVSVCATSPIGGLRRRAKNLQISTMPTARRSLFAAALITAKTTNGPGRALRQAASTNDMNGRCWPGDGA